MLDNLQGGLEKMFHCFSKNNLKANAGKCHLLTSSKTPVDIPISNTEIFNELNEERVKGMLRPIFCIDINTHSDRK